jgi:hypothetical protein
VRSRPFYHLSLSTILVSSKQWKVLISMADPNTLSVFISAMAGYTTTSASKQYGIDIRQYW